MSETITRRRRPRTLDGARLERRSKWRAPKTGARGPLFAITLSPHLDLGELLIALPSSGDSDLTDQQFEEQIRRQLWFYRARREEHVARKPFKRAARGIKKKVEALRDLLPLVSDEPRPPGNFFHDPWDEAMSPPVEEDDVRKPLSPGQNVALQVDHITGIQTSTLLAAALADYSSALDQVLRNEGVRGREADEPGRQLVVALALIYHARTGRKANAVFSPARRSARQASVTNKFEAFVVAVEQAFLAAVRAEARGAQSSNNSVRGLRLSERRACIRWAVKELRSNGWRDPF